MTKNTIYKYKLENGNTAILSSKVSSCEPILELRADKGKLLTNGTNVSKSVIVSQDEIADYYEVDDDDYYEN